MIACRRMLKSIVPAAAFTATGIGRGGAAPLDVVRIAQSRSLSDAPYYIAETKGYFREQRLDVSLTFMAIGWTMIAPLGAGQLDVAGPMLTSRPASIARLPAGTHRQ